VPTTFHCGHVERGGIENVIEELLQLLDEIDGGIWSPTGALQRPACRTGWPMSARGSVPARKSTGARSVAI
jgi:hypothetical protein